MLDLWRSFSDRNEARDEERRLFVARIHPRKGGVPAFDVGRIRDPGFGHGVTGRPSRWSNTGGTRTDSPLTAVMNHIEARTGQEPSDLETRRRVVPEHSMQLDIPLLQIGDIWIRIEHTKQGEIDIDQAHTTARAYQPSEMINDGLLPTPVVRQNMTHHHHVDARRGDARIRRLARSDFHILQTRSPNHRAGLHQRVGVAFDADHGTVRADDFTKDHRHRGRTTPDISDGRARNDARLHPHVRFRGARSLRHDPITRNLSITERKRVVRHRRGP